MTTHNAEIVPIEWTAAGQVITYRSERPDRWCREGWAISDDNGRFLDTYWQSMSESHVLTAAEIATAEHQFWLDDYAELDRYRRGTPDEWAKYAPADRGRIPSQHGLQARWFIRHGAEFDLPTQIENAHRVLDSAVHDLEAAQRRLKDAEERLDQLREDQRTRPGLPMSGGA